MPISKRTKYPYLFVSTEPVGNNGYIWDQIKEIDKYDFVTIGHHSHTQIIKDKPDEEFIQDTELK